jgi:hypothetical protein
LVKIARESIRDRIRDAERQELRRQFDFEMEDVLIPMIKEFRSNPRTPNENKEFFERYEQMFREWAKEYLAQKYLDKH